MQDILMFATILAPILTAIMQVVKTTWALPKKWVPMINLLLGIGLGAAAVPFTDLDLVMRLWAGGFAGLSSVGLFEMMNKREGMTRGKDRSE